MIFPFINIRQRFSGDDRALLGVAALKLCLQLYAVAGYGRFRDEFYYLACGEHLDWGYVDHPPLVAVIAKGVRIVLGDSLFGLRLLPALCGAVVVFLTGLIARELGAKRPGQCLAALAAVVAPVYLSIHHIFSMNAFDHVFWTVAVYLLVLILKHDRPSLWIPFGLVVGLGLQNKISLLFLGFGTFVGLVLTPARKHFKTKHLWVGAALAGLVFLPHVLWQVAHDWPTREFMANAQKYKNYAYTPFEFLWSALLEAHPFNIVLIASGLYFYFVKREGKPFRLLGWTFAAILGLFLVQKAKSYYLAPALPILFAAGGTMFERLTAEHPWSRLRPAQAAVLALGGMLTAPLALPLLPVETYRSYSAALGIQGVKSENHGIGKLPQFFADMHGWENMAATVSGVYRDLPSNEKALCAVYGQNYGEAGAIDFWRKKYELPRAIAGHNNYFFWGHGEPLPTVLVIIGGEREDHEQVFADVREAATVVSEYAMPYENNLPVFVCRTPKIDLRAAWPRVKHYD